MLKYKLICFDMDGVLFEHRNVWLELHKRLGTFEEGEALTDKYLKNDYSKLVDEVVGRLWKGKPAQPYLDIINEMRYLKGVPETMNVLKANGYKISIISSGSLHAAMRAQTELGVDYISANELVIKDDVIIGDFKWPVAYDRKAVVLKQLAEDHNLHLSETIVVGDSPNDIKMMRLAGLGIAFCSESEELKKVANIVIDTPDLREILPHIAEFENKEVFGSMHRV